MSYRATDIAAEFIRLGVENNHKLTHMQVQKLVYIAEGFSLALLDKQLFCDEITAWRFGPVIRDLYNTLGSNKNNLIDSAPKGAQDIKDVYFKKIIYAVFDRYGEMGAWKLSAMTHKEGTPWYRVWNTEPFGVITPDAMRDYYKELLYSHDGK